MKRRNVLAIIYNRNRYFIYFFLFIFRCFSIVEITISQNLWQPLNGPYGGDIRNLAINQNGTIVINTKNCLYSSTDRGENWEQIPNSLNLYDFGPVAFSSKGDIFVVIGGNIYRFTASSKDWVLVYKEKESLIVSSIAINSSGYIFIGHEKGMLRSEDNGSNWVEIDSGFNQKNLKVNAIAIVDDSTIYVGKNDGLYESINNGDSWIKTNFAEKAIQFMAVRNGKMLVGTSDSSFYYSTDNGKNWKESLNGFYKTGIISIIINSKGNIFAGTYSNGVYCSTDNGENWIKTNLNGVLVTNLAIDQADIIFAGTAEKGIYRTTDNGDNWLDINKGIKSWFLLSIAINLRGQIFASYYNGFVFRSDDNGETWKQINKGFVINPCSMTTYVNSFVFNSKGDVYAGTLGGMYRSTDNGDNWTQVNNGIKSETEVVYVITNSSDHIFGVCFSCFGSLNSTMGVVRSTDNGRTWEVKNNGLKSRVLTIAINSEGYIFAGTEAIGRPGDSIGYPGLYRSTDNGDNWTRLNLKNVSIRSMVINKNGHILVGGVQWDNTEIKDTSALFRSTDNGETWVQLDKSMNNRLGKFFTINSKGYIFGVSNGVLRSTNDGESWTEFNSGLIPLSGSPLIINSLVINSNDIIYTGLENGGIFRSINPTTSVEKVSEEIPKLFNLEQNYPNPFNPSTVINYQLPINSFVTLKIYDILGNEIATLINEKQTAGLHNITWEAKNVPAGMYFYRFQTERYSEVMKMVLIR